MRATLPALALALGAISTFASPVEKRQELDLDALFENVPAPDFSVLPQGYVDPLANAPLPASLTKSKRDFGCFSETNTQYPPDIYSDESAVAAAAVPVAGDTQIYSNKFFASDYSHQSSVSTNLYFQYTADLSAYNVAQCRAHCLANQGCLAYNIYWVLGTYQDCSELGAAYVVCDALMFLPSANPNTNYDNANSQTFLNYQVVGSNAYLLNQQPTVPTLDGFQAGHSLDNCVINAPLDVQNNNINTFMASKTYTSPDYSQCAKACNDQSTYNAKHPKADGTFNTCNYFTVGQVYSGDTLQGIMCAFYTKDWSSIESTNKQCGNRGKTYKGAASYLVNGYTSASRTEIPQSRGGIITH